MKRFQETGFNNSKRQKSCQSTEMFLGNKQQKDDGNNQIKYEVAHEDFDGLYENDEDFQYPEYLAENGDEDDIVVVKDRCDVEDNRMSCSSHDGDRFVQHSEKISCNPDEKELVCSMKPLQQESNEFFLNRNETVKHLLQGRKIIDQHYLYYDLRTYGDMTFYHM
jgi:hypothetical protein